MNKEFLSRREFLKFASRLGIAGVLGSLLKFFPEAKIALAKANAQNSPLMQMPEDLVMEPVEGKEASKSISKALKDKDARALQEALPSFEPLEEEAQVTSAVWAGGTQEGLVVSVPFRNAQGAEAALLQVVMNGNPQSVMVEFTDKTDLSQANVYLVQDGQVTLASKDSSPQASGMCTTDCLLQCLPLWGCSGLAFTLCAAAILSCPFFIATCIAAWACTLYCGGAFSYCWCWCCGC